MLSTIIHETAVRVFKFHHGDCLYKGICFQRYFYKQVASFEVQHKPKMYAVLTQIRQSGYLAIVTLSLDRYNVWVEIRAEIDALSMPLQSYSPFEATARSGSMTSDPGSMSTPIPQHTSIPNHYRKYLHR